MGLYAFDSSIVLNCLLIDVYLVVIFKLFIKSLKEYPNYALAY